MKLDPTVMHHMNGQDYRVLEAVERGMKDHGSIVSLQLTVSLANLRHGGCHKIVSSLLRDKLLSHENSSRGKGKCGQDGYRLTNAGYDILALHNLKTRKIVAAMGQKIGTGKESDIYLACTPNGRQVVLKFHRLGRTSFRNVRKKRDYLSHSNKNNNKAQLQINPAHSWLFLSKLSAAKEFAFMKALYDTRAYVTPIPLGHNRHIVCMSLVRGLPMYQLYPKQLSTHQTIDMYRQAVNIAVQLASVHGLVHCDLNEFNLLVDLSGVQAKITNDDQDDPYVRHSGRSVVVTNGANSKQSESVAVGLLSKPAWEQSLEDEAIQDGNNAVVEPAARLENGEPKPIVTLIDFPQMISCQHVNAQEYYERDLHCLHRFFTRKLQLQVPPEDDPVTSARAQWTNIIRRHDDDGAAAVGCGGGSGSGDVIGGRGGGGSGGVTAGKESGENDDEGNDDIIIMNRLDTELRASGYSGGGGANAAAGEDDLELYYFETGPRPVESGIAFGVVREEDDEDGSDGDDDVEGGDNEIERSSDGDVVSIDDEDGDDKAQNLELLTNNLYEGGDAHEGTAASARRVVVVEGSSSSINDMLNSLSATGMSRQELEEQAKARVRKQLDDQKRKSNRKGALRSKRNNNKNYVKGKRVMAESVPGF